MKKETAFKIIAFVFIASVLCSFSYILQNIRYLIYAIIPCIFAVMTYINDKRQK